MRVRVSESESESESNQKMLALSTDWQGYGPFFTPIKNQGEMKGQNPVVLLALHTCQVATVSRVWFPR